ncbi:MAG: glucose 1-dehydrogenase [Myxococcota bacterium]
MAGRVAGKVAIVTGGASGIGRGTAEVLLREGARVAITDVNESLGREAEKELGSDALFVRHDVTQEADWEHAIAATRERFGPLDVLVNNAGVIEPGDPESSTLALVEKVFAVNFSGVFLGCKYAIAAMRESGGGSIINMSSASGLVGFPTFAVYGASKAAVRGFTKSVAAHCIERGDPIRCNSIHPGGVDTPGIRSLQARTGVDPATVDNAPEDGRYLAGTPQEIGELVLYLASDASRYMNGSELAIDGGLTAV